MIQNEHVFCLTYCQLFGSIWDPLGASSGSQNGTQKRARADPWLPGPHPGVDLASSKRHYGILTVLGVAFSPFLAPDLGLWRPFWTLWGSILHPPGLHPDEFCSNLDPVERPNLSHSGDDFRIIRYILNRNVEALSK